MVTTRIAKPTPNGTAESKPDKPAQKRLPVVLWAPNLIGYVRVVTMVMGMLEKDAASTMSIWCFTISLLLDYIDGPVARKLDQCSQFGDLLDHYTDHLTMMYLVYATSDSSAFGRINIFASGLHNGSACLYMLVKGHYMKHSKGNTFTRAIEANNYWNMLSLLWGFNTYIIPLIKMSYAHDFGMGVTSTTSMLGIIDAIGMTLTLGYTIAMWI